MSKKLNTEQITNELRGSSSFFNDQDQTKRKNDVVTSQSDITTSHVDVTTPTIETLEDDYTLQSQSENQGRLDIEKLQTVIKSLSEIPYSAFTTPVRLSNQEKKDIEDFIFITLRKNDLQGNAVSISKLMRYCLRYMMKIHEDEFIEALKKALRKDTTLPI
jgi:hypothetical protein